MTKEEKQLLLVDLCGRIPYGFVVHRYCDNCDISIEDMDNFAHFLEYSEGEEFKPYLRPMSSMTQKEIDEYDAELDKDMDIVMNGSLDRDRHMTSDGKHTFSKNFVAHFGNDWLNKRGFDYRGLIPKGLALEAPKGMYKNRR